MERSLEIIKLHSEAGSELRNLFFANYAKEITEVAKKMAVSITRGGKILLAGNGGSAADAQHWAGEMVNRFIIDRPPLPAIALTTDSSVITSIANDFGYKDIFAKQIEALGHPGDIFLAISTSGRSENLIQALQHAKKQDIFSIGITSDDGGTMAEFCDILLPVPIGEIEKKFAHRGKVLRTPLIQEVHEALGHLLCGLLDHFLYVDMDIVLPLLSQGGRCPLQG